MFWRRREEVVKIWNLYILENNEKGGDRYGRSECIARRWAVQEWCDHPDPQCPPPEDVEEDHVQFMDGDYDGQVVGKACKRGRSQRVGTGGRCVPILVHSVPESGTGGLLADPRIPSQHYPLLS